MSEREAHAAFYAYIPLTQRWRRAFQGDLTRANEGESQVAKAMEELHEAIVEPIALMRHESTLRLKESVKDNVAAPGLQANYVNGGL